MTTGKRVPFPVLGAQIACETEQHDMGMSFEGSPCCAWLEGRSKGKSTILRIFVQKLAPLFGLGLKGDHHSWGSPILRHTYGKLGRAGVPFLCRTCLHPSL